LKLFSAYYFWGAVAAATQPVLPYSRADDPGAFVNRTVGNPADKRAPGEARKFPAARSGDDAVERPALDPEHRA